jgi:hypothetical protein
MELDDRLQKAAAIAANRQQDTAPAAGAAGAAHAGAAQVAAAGGMVSAAAAAQREQPGAAGLLPAAAASPGAGEGTVLQHMRKATGMMQSALGQAPGYARMMQDSFVSAAQAAAGAIGGPEHVPQPAAGRASTAGMQETELERKTRELQVGAVGCGWRLATVHARGLLESFCTQQQSCLHASVRCWAPSETALPLALLLCGAPGRPSSSSSSRSAEGRRRSGCWRHWRAPIWAFTGESPWQRWSCSAPACTGARSRLTAPACLTASSRCVCVWGGAARLAGCWYCNKPG